MPAGDAIAAIIAELADVRMRVANLERLEKSSYTAHDPVTLDMNSVQVNSLTGQELGHQVQAHNFVWSGPESGAAAVPTFRLLVTGDVPIDSDTYNAAATAVLGTDADGGVRVDHMEVGNTTGAAEGVVKAAVGLVSVGYASYGSGIARYCGSVTLAAGAQSAVLADLPDGVWLVTAIGGDLNWYAIAWVRVRSGSGSVLSTVAAAKVDVLFAGDDLYLKNTDASYGITLTWGVNCYQY